MIRLLSLPSSPKTTLEKSRQLTEISENDASDKSSRRVVPGTISWPTQVSMLPFGELFLEQPTELQRLHTTDKES